jgi:uncharacterized protein DUF4412
MKTSIRLTIALAILVACAVAQVPAMPQFSTDITVTSAAEGQQMKGKMFVDKGKMRMDFNAQGRDMSMITDSAKETTYVLMHEQKMYMERKAGADAGRRRGPRMPDVKQMGENPCATEKDVTCKKVGTETVNGRTCDKWEFTSTANPKDNRTAWVDQKTHMPIKTVSAESTMEMTNFKEGPQDAKTFEVPSDYQKFDPAMMGGRGPGRNQ